MASFIDLRPGLRLNVIPGHGMLSASYQTVIRRLTDEGIRVDRPRRGDHKLELQPGDEVTLLVQLHGRVYTCTSAVVQVQEIPVESMLIEHPTEVTHSERRQFYRLFTNITPRYAARTNEDGDELERLEIRIIDISGGGVQMRVGQSIPVGCRVRLIFALGGDPFEIDVTVLGLSAQRPSGRRSFYRANARFSEIERAMQERIVRFIFRQQMVRRQKLAI